MNTSRDWPILRVLLSLIAAVLFGIAGWQMLQGGTPSFGWMQFGFAAMALAYGIGDYFRP